MDRNNKNQMCKDALSKLLKNRERIIRAVTVYGEYVYDAFERMIKISTWKVGMYEVSKVCVAYGRTSETAYCFVEGYNPETGDKIANLADGFHDVADKFISEEATEIAGDLDYINFDEIEAVWEIIYNVVLPNGMNTEIIYDFNTHNISYTGDSRESREIEQTSLISVWCAP